MGFWSRLWNAVKKATATPAPVVEVTAVNHLETVKAERAKYGTPLGKDGAHKVINAVAWIHRAEGLGLLKAPDGVDSQDHGCRLDILLCRETREAWDVLGSSDEAGVPAWSPIEYLSDFTDRWVAPYDPNPVVVPDPVDPPPDPVDPPIVPSPVLARLEAAITAFCKSWLGV